MHQQGIRAEPTLPQTPPAPIRPPSPQRWTSLPREHQRQLAQVVAELVRRQWQARVREEETNDE